jgi:uncharacterized protein (TIGR03000 family)
LVASGHYQPGGNPSGLADRLKSLEDRLARIESKLNNPTPPLPTPTPGGVKPGGDTVAYVSPNTARITVSLPASAQLFVDNVECPLTSGTRSFVTPRLVPGTQYYYTFRMRNVHEGQTQDMSRRVLLTAGQHVQVNFNNPGALSTARR